VDARERFEAEKGFFGFASSPLVVDELLLVQVGGRKGGVVAFDIASGSVSWIATLDESSYASPVLVKWNDKLRPLVWTRERLLLLNESDGGILKEFGFRSGMRASVNGATPLVWEPFVFLSESYGEGAVLLSLDGDAGEFRTVWREADLLSNHYATSIYRDGFLYGFHGRQEYGAELRCVDAKTGKVRWGKEGLGMGLLSLVDGKLLVLTENGEFVVIEARSDSFRLMHRSQVSASGARAYPAFSTGRMFLRDPKALYAYELRAKAE
jgi:outer membrane protein assembly factor BamB